MMCAVFYVHIQCLFYCQCLFIHILFASLFELPSTTGTVSREILMSLPDDECMERLCALRGIGEWSVHMFMMFSLRRADVFPYGDLAVRCETTTHRRPKCIWIKVMLPPPNNTQVLYSFLFLEMQVSIQFRCFFLGGLKQTPVPSFGEVHLVLVFECSPPGSW